MVFWSKKRLPKVSKFEFMRAVESIGSHFRNIKDMHIHAINRVDSIQNSHNALSNHVKAYNEYTEKWIRYLFNKSERQSKVVDSLKEDINSLKEETKFLKKKKRDSEKFDEEFIKGIIDSYVQIPKKDLKILKEDIISELRGIKKGKIDVINVNNDYNDYNATQNRDNAGHNEVGFLQHSVSQSRLTFTRSEQRILSSLFNAAEPKTYIDLAHSTGHSPNTIKVYINSLKKKGVIFEEHNAPNGTKLYAIPNREKLKKLHNF